MLYHSCLTSKGKEIIEYYLRQLEEEGITFVPRWTPPSLGPSSEPLSASKSQTTSAAVLVPDAAALKEGLSGEGLSSPGTASEAVVGTPDGESGTARGPVGLPPPPWLCPAVSPRTVDLAQKRKTICVLPCLPSLPLPEHLHLFFLTK